MKCRPGVWRGASFKAGQERRLHLHPERAAFPKDIYVPLSHLQYVVRVIPRSSVCWGIPQGFVGVWLCLLTRDSFTI